MVLDMAFLPRRFYSLILLVVQLQVTVSLADACHAKVPAEAVRSLLQNMVAPKIRPMMHPFVIELLETEQSISACALATKLEKIDTSGP